jgi:hypothetical protein
MTPEEVDAFLQNGRGSLTGLTLNMEKLANWSSSFDERGGQPVYGDDALNIVTFNNELQDWLTPARRATISKYRTDV